MELQFVLFVCFASCLRVVCVLCERQVIFHCCVIFHCDYTPVCVLILLSGNGHLELCSLGPVFPGGEACPVRATAVCGCDVSLGAVCHAPPVTFKEGRGRPGRWVYQLLVLREGWGQGKAPENEGEQTLCVSKHTLSVRRAVLTVASATRPMGHCSRDPQSSSWLPGLAIVLAAPSVEPRVPAGVRPV